MAILTTFFAIVAIALALAVFVRINKIQHPSVLIGGTLLLVLIGASMLLSLEFAGSVELIPATQTAAVIDAVVSN